jgi:hypothetical protein
MGRHGHLEYEGGRFQDGKPIGEPSCLRQVRRPRHTAHVFSVKAAISRMPADGCTFSVTAIPRSPPASMVLASIGVTTVLTPVRASNANAFA